MTDLVTAIWLGIVGGCLGSFLNVVAYRMPLKMSIVWKPSHCPNCRHPIRAFDNLPVVGWVRLKGKCRDCGSPISPRYALVEGVMAAAFFAMAYVELFSGASNLPCGPLTEARGSWEIVWNPQWSVIGLFAYHAVLLCLLMTVALIDLDNHVVPTRLGAAVAIAVVGLVLTPTGCGWDQLRSSSYFFWQVGALVVGAVLVGWRSRVLPARKELAPDERHGVNLSYALALGAAAVPSLNLAIAAVALGALSLKQLSAGLQRVLSPRWLVPIVCLLFFCWLLVPRSHL